MKSTPFELKVTQEAHGFGITRTQHVSTFINYLKIVLIVRKTFTDDGVKDNMQTPKRMISSTYTRRYEIIYAYVSSVKVFLLH